MGKYAKAPSKSNKIVKGIIVCVLAVVLGIVGITCFLSMDHVDEYALEEAIREEYAILTGYSTDGVNSLITTLYNGFEVDVLSTEDQNGEIKVKCCFSNYDVAAAFIALNGIDADMTYTNYMQELTKTVEDQEKLRQEVTVLVVADVDNQYTVKFTEEQLDLAMGGFLSYYQSQYGTEAKG